MNGERKYRLEWEESTQQWHLDNYTHQENTNGWQTITDEITDTEFEKFENFIKFKTIKKPIKTATLKKLYKIFTSELDMKLYTNIPKYVVNYHSLDDEGDVKVIPFKTPKKRASFLFEKIVSENCGGVYVLIINKNISSDLSVYIFDKISDIEPHLLTLWKDVSLFECDSYEDAYKLALDLKEINPRCYSKD
jgi:hypothetical protein